MLKEFVIVGIVLLFIGASIVSGFNLTSISQPINRGWLYVGGSGPWNYTTIQSAINNASSGDTVFVFKGIYYENVIINKVINLFGEDRSHTIIDGNRNGDVVSIGGSILNNFTIRNSGGSIWSIAGIGIYYSNNIISNCSIYNCSSGCFFTGSGNNNTIINCDINNNTDGIAGFLRGFVIKNCKIQSNFYAMELSGSNNTIVNCSIYNSIGWIFDFQAFSDNKMKNCKFIDNNGMCRFFGESTYNLISDCIFSNCGGGLWLVENSNNNTIRNNTFRGNQIGVSIQDNAHNNLIYHNNFINNTLNANDECENFWDNGYPSGGNYWSNYTGNDSNHDGIGDTPYNISGGNNQDLYPLMHPFEMYYILNISLDNHDVDEGKTFNVTVKTLGGTPVYNALVNFSGTITTTDDNGEAVLTAPMVQEDTVYPIIATKSGYTSDNDTILVKNVPQEIIKTIIFGRYAKLTEDDGYLSIEAVNLWVISFQSTLHLTNGEHLTFLKDTAKVLILPRFIIGIVEVVV